MSIEVFPNNYQTTLDGAIDDSVTSVVVAAAPSDVSTGNFRIKIGSEIMKVTSFAGTTLTVARAQEGTSAASHSDGVAVKGTLSAAALLNLRGDAIVSGVLASAPAATPAGRLYFPSDAPYALLSDGSAIDQVGPIYRFTPVVNGDYSWVNQGGASVSTANGGVFLTCPATSSPPQLRIRAKAQPTPPYTLTAVWTIDIYPTGADQIGGIGFRESGTGKLETFHLVYSSGIQLVVSKWTDETTYVADRLAKPFGDCGSPRFLRIKHDGTNLIYQYSVSGYFWRTFASAAKNNFFTTAPDQVFFFGNAAAATYDVGVHLLSWKEE